MGLGTPADWLTWGGVVLPLAVLAWSAWRYVALQAEEQKHRRYQQFFDTIGKLDTAGSVAGKCAAAHQLRHYLEYGEFIERFCRDVQPYVGGESGALLNSELRRTAEYFETKRGTPR